ncbi:MAG: uncharacterized protein JWL62_976 [Hyphomicrobiales bacterium]|nr:uncharacterized protein [Hyphomicrobiales bacterium]
MALSDPFGSLAGSLGLFNTQPVEIASLAVPEKTSDPATPSPWRRIEDLMQPKSTPPISAEVDAPNAGGADTVPLPPRRAQAPRDNADRTTGRVRERRSQQQAVAMAPAADNRGFFEKMFNVQPASTPVGPVLAYARTDDEGLRGGASSGGRRLTGALEGGTAVYDISAHAVFLPNGEKLEAHSGLGDLLDDPNRVNEKNRGATPPNVYDLKPREALFHGVPALRLTPVGDAPMYGRTGLLAHTYMLGANGDSNGCISFKNYGRFLEAYRNGEVKRLVVVTRRT